MRIVWWALGLMLAGAAAGFVAALVRPRPPAAYGTSYAVGADSTSASGSPGLK